LDSYAREQDCLLPLLALADPSELCIRILRSRSVQVGSSGQLDLRDVYSVQGYEVAREKLDRATDILAGKGPITIYGD